MTTKGVRLYTGWLQYASGIAIGALLGWAAAFLLIDTSAVEDRAFELAEQAYRLGCLEANGELCTLRSIGYVVALRKGIIHESR